VWLPGSRVCAELGHKDELNRANMWQDPDRSWLRGGIKGLVQVMLEFSFFKLVVPPSARRGRTISDMKYLVPHPFGVGGNQTVSIFIGP
jgi:hypothetical protein